MRPGTPWFGYVNQLVYGLSFDRPIDQSDIATRAESVVLERGIRGREKLFEAASAALASGEPIVDGRAVEGDEAHARDFLERLVHELEARQPWPELPYRELDAAEAGGVLDAPVIGELPFGRNEVGDRLGVWIGDLPGTGRAGAVLELRGGQVVALIAPSSFTETGVKLLAATPDPDVVARTFTELTGLEVAR
jgi:hypothetical protein